MGSCCSCCGDDKTKEQDPKQKPLAQNASLDTDTKKAVDTLAPNRPKGSHRDRLIALFAKYERENLPLIDLWMQKLGGPRRSEVYIKDYLKKHAASSTSKSNNNNNNSEATEPASKHEALKECLLKYYTQRNKKIENGEPLSDHEAEDDNNNKHNNKLKSPTTSTARSGSVTSSAAGSPGNASNGTAKPSSHAATPTNRNDGNNKNKFPPTKIADVPKKVDEMMERFEKIKPGEETPFFVEIFGPGRKEKLEEEEDLSNLAKQGSFAAGEALRKEADEVLRKIAEQEEREKREAAKRAKGKHYRRDRKDCTCDEDMKERIMAMMIEHCPERFDDICEERHYHDSESGAELLFSLIEEFGEEPTSKLDAITNCYRRLLEEHDPQRLKSLPTLVAAAMSASSMSTKAKRKKLKDPSKISNNNSRNNSRRSSVATSNSNHFSNNNKHAVDSSSDEEEIEMNGSQQAIAKVLRTYGVLKPNKNLNATNGSSSTPFGNAIANTQSSQSTDNDFSDILSRRKRLPPQELRQQTFVPPYAITMDSEVQKEFSTVPIPNRHELISNYDKAKYLVDSLSPVRQRGGNNDNDDRDENEQDNGAEKTGDDKNNNNKKEKRDSAAEMIDDMLDEFMESKEQQQQKKTTTHNQQHKDVDLLRAVEEKLRKQQELKQQASAAKRQNNINNNNNNGGGDFTSSSDDDEDEKDDQGNNNAHKNKNVFNPEHLSIKNKTKNRVLPDMSLVAPSRKKNHGDSSSSSDEERDFFRPSPSTSSNAAVAVNHQNKQKTEETPKKSTAAATPPPPPRSSPPADYSAFDEDL